VIQHEEFTYTGGEEGCPFQVFLIHTHTSHDTMVVLLYCMTS